LILLHANGFHKVCCLSMKLTVGTIWAVLRCCTGEKWASGIPDSSYMGTGYFESRCLGGTERRQVRG
jgi:hypothetical protein